MSIIDNANSLLEENNSDEVLRQACSRCGDPILKSQSYSMERRMNGDVWHNDCNKAKTTVLEEGMAPIDFAIKIGKQTKRIHRLLKSKGWSLPKKNDKNSEYLNIGFMGESDTLKRISILSIPNSERIDDLLNKDKSWIPTVTLTNYHSSDGGKSWQRYQEKFQFDNANTIVRTSNNIMEYSLEDVYEYQDLVDNEGVILGGEWEKLIKKATKLTLKKEKVIG